MTDSKYYFIPEERFLFNKAKEFIGGELECVKIERISELMLRYGGKVVEDLNVYRYLDIFKLPLPYDLDFKPESTSQHVLTFKYKEELFFVFDYFRAELQTYYSLLFFKKGNHHLIKELWDALNSFVKESKMMWLWNNKWLPVNDFDTSTFVVPSLVEGLFKSRVYPQLEGREVYNHVLLYSPPGYGKTAFIRYLSQKFAKWTFIVVTPAMIEKPCNIISAFNDALTYKPSVLFFEDIDTFGQHRGISNELMNPFLGTLLNLMDGMEPVTETMIIGSTNNPTVLDPALNRAGRFGVHVPFSYTRNERVRMLNGYLKTSFSSSDVAFIGTVSPTDIRSIAKSTLAKVNLGDALSPSLVSRVMKEILAKDRVNFDFKEVVEESKTESSSSQGPPSLTPIVE